MPGDPGNISVILSPQEYYITENREADVESGIVDPAGEGESGTYWESGSDIDTQPCMK